MFEHSSNSCIDEAKEEEEVVEKEEHTSKRAGTQSHVREYDFGVQSALFLFRSENLDPE